MSRAPRQLYFAFGSNLWLQQMASRCPSSTFIGRAILPDYRWQINERGYANVVARSGYSVHGLVYEIDAEDEARLDRNEGVHTGAYSKAYKSVILHPASPELQMRTRWLVEGSSGIPRVVKTLRALRSKMGNLEQEPYLEGRVLIYLSEEFTRHGEPKEEYINRMNAGIRDAITLGVPTDFFDDAVRVSIPNRPVLRRTHQRVTSLEETPPVLLGGGGRPRRRARSEQPLGRRALEDRYPPESRRSRDDQLPLPPRLVTVQRVPQGLGPSGTFFSRFARPFSREDQPF